MFVVAVVTVLFCKAGAAAVALYATVLLLTTVV